MPPKKLPPAPHLVEPKFGRVTDRNYRSFHDAVSRGFQEPIQDELAEFDRALIENERHFGFKVGQRWVATCGAFTRTLTVPGGAEVPFAAVSLVTVQPPYRRRGLLRRMMEHQLRDIADRGEPLAGLWASEAMIYGRFGYAPAVSRARLSGRNSRLDFLSSVRPTGSVDEVDRDQFLAVAPALHAADRPQRPGGLNRPDTWWKVVLYDAESVRGGASELHRALHYDEAGDVDGYALFRFKSDWGDNEPSGEVRIDELRAADVGGYASLWRYLLDLDLARNFRWRKAAVDESLRHLVGDARAVKTEIEDALYLRVVDVAAALAERRYSADVDVVIEVTDDLLPENTGRHRLDVTEGTATVTRARAAADLSMTVLELGAIYLGGVSLHDLHRAGRVVEHASGAVAAAADAFAWHRAPWCPDNF